MKALLVDGLNLIRRIHAAVPISPESGADSAPDGAHASGVIQSCCSSLNRAMHDHKPSHALVIMEYGGKSWRHEVYSEYKKNRPSMPDDLQPIINDIGSAFEKMGVHCFHLDGFEADDIIATLACKIADHGGNVVILSTDRFQCQLIRVGIQVYDHFAGKFLDHSYIEKRFAVRPDQLVDLLALAGDGSVSIPGVKSVGLKTAAKLLNEYDDLDKLFSRLDEIGGKLSANLAEGKENAQLARTLFRLKTDLELGINLNQFRYEDGGGK